MPSLSLLGFTSLFYATFLPLLLMMFVSLLFIPCLLQARNTPASDVGTAIISYLFMSIAAILILSGSIPWVFSLLSFQPTSKEAVLTFLVLLGTGILTALIAKRAQKNIGGAAKEIPHAIFVTSFTASGLLLMLLGILLLLLSGLTGQGAAASAWAWWIAPVILFLVGLILTIVFSPRARKDSRTILVRLKLLK